MAKKFILSILTALLTSCVRVDFIPRLNSTTGLIGQDHLALQQPNYKPRIASRVLGQGTPVGSLDYTFSADISPVRDLLSRLSPNYYRVHLIDTVCVRNRNCGPYSIVAGYTIQSLDAAIKAHNPKILKFVSDRTLVYKNLFKDFPDTTPLISPALEHNLSIQSYRILADEVLSVWRKVQLVNNGMSGTTVERYRGAYLEDHGYNPRYDAELTSLDGTDATDISIAKWLKRTENKLIRFVWTRGYNCRTQGEFVDPRKRTACSNEVQLELMADITEKYLPRPSYTGSGCNNILSFESPSISKPLAEDKGTGDPRANLPVVITKPVAPFIDVRASNGITVAIFGKYKDNFIDGRPRYYSGYSPGTKLDGWTILEKAKATAGNPYVWYRIGNTCYGPLLTGRRQGQEYNGHN